MTPMQAIVGAPLPLALAVLALVAGPAAAAPAPAPAGDVAHGKQLFLSVGCYQCHGTSGEGGSERTAPRVAPDPLAWPYFVNQLRAPRAQMPIYTALILPDQDAADIYAFLKSQPQPKKVADIPLLNR
jgi:mono/diheme cytochrome c family protein